MFTVVYLLFCHTKHYFYFYPCFVILLQMASRNKSCIASSQSFLFIIIMIFTFITIRYILPVRVPGPMMHPIKYKIVTGSFGLILDIVSNINKFIKNFQTLFYSVVFLNRLLVFLIIQYLIPQSILMIELKSDFSIMVKYW